MIGSFRHRGLKALYEGRASWSVPPEHVERIRYILTALDHSREPEGMNLPGLGLSELEGTRSQRCAVTVSDHGCITFRFEDGVAVEVDYVDA